MKITKEDLKVRFDEYNRLYFGGKLGKCTFSARKIGSFGFYFFKTAKSGKLESRITLTTNVNWTEDSLRDVLVHEMIHHYVVTIDGCKWVDGWSWYGLFGHGKHFRRQVRRIERENGLKIYIHGYPALYHKHEKIPTTTWGKFVRFIDYNLT